MFPIVVKLASITLASAPTLLHMHCEIHKSGASYIVGQLSNCPSLPECDSVISQARKSIRKYIPIHSHQFECFPYSQATYCFSRLQLRLLNATQNAACIKQWYSCTKAVYSHLSGPTIQAPLPSLLPRQSPSTKTLLLCCGRNKVSNKQEVLLFCCLGIHLLEPRYHHTHCRLAVLPRLLA